MADLDGDPDSLIHVTLDTYAFCDAPCLTAVAVG